MKKIYYALLMLTVWISPSVSQSIVHIDQIGNNNTITVHQNDSGKNADIQIRGDLNDIQSTQTGSGSHSTNLSSGNTASSSNVIRFQQSGSGNHTATLDIVGSTGSNNVLFNQSGSANKSFNMTIFGSGVSAIVSQTNPTIPDAGSMSITCLSPPCSGYSYTRN